MAALLSHISAFLPAFLVSPGMYAGMLLVLASSRYPIKRALSILAGSLLVVIVVGVVAVTAGSALTDPGQPSKVSALIDLLLGALLLYLGISSVFKKKEGRLLKLSQPADQASAVKAHLLKFGVLGIVLTVTNPTSLASYLAAAKLTVDSGLNFWEQFVAMAVAAFYYTLPIIMPLAIALLAPSYSKKFLEAAQHVVQKYGRYVVAVILVLLGAHLAQKGLRVLI